MLFVFLVPLMLVNTDYQKGVPINRRNPKTGERWEPRAPPIWDGAWLTHHT